MVDAAVSNTIGVKLVRVRVPPPAPGSSFSTKEHASESLLDFAGAFVELPLCFI